MQSTMKKMYIWYIKEPIIWYQSSLYAITDLTKDFWEKYGCSIIVRYQALILLALPDCACSAAWSPVGRTCLCERPRPRTQPPRSGPWHAPAAGSSPVPQHPAQNCAHPHWPGRSGWAGPSLPLLGPKGVRKKTKHLYRVFKYTELQKTKKSKQLTVSSKASSSGVEVRLALLPESNAAVLPSSRSSPKFSGWARGGFVFLRKLGTSSTPLDPETKKEMHVILHC